MTPALETALAEAGLRVGATEFLGLIVDAARRLTPAAPDPMLYFSPEQRTALSEAGLDLTPQTEREPDARARTVAAHTVLTESALSVGDVARLLNVDTSRIRHRLKEARLAGWKIKGEWHLPAWQFTGSSVLPGLEVVLHAVPEDQPALVVASFMSTPQVDLEINGRPATPRQWLLAGGDPDRVAALASTIGTPA